MSQGKPLQKLHYKRSPEALKSNSLKTLQNILRRQFLDSHQVFMEYSNNVSF